MLVRPSLGHSSENRAEVIACHLHDASVPWTYLWHGKGPPISGWLERVRRNQLSLQLCESRRGLADPRAGPPSWLPSCSRHGHGVCPLPSLLVHAPRGQIHQGRWAPQCGYLVLLAIADQEVMHLKQTCCGLLMEPHHTVLTAPSVVAN